MHVHVHVLVDWPRLACMCACLGEEQQGAKLSVLVSGSEQQQRCMSAGEACMHVRVFVHAPNRCMAWPGCSQSRETGKEQSRAWSAEIDVSKDRRPLSLGARTGATRGVARLRTDIVCGRARGSDAAGSVGFVAADQPSVPFCTLF